METTSSSGPPTLLRACRALARRVVVVVTDDRRYEGLLTSWTPRSIWLVDHDTDVVVATAAIRSISTSTT